jgi:hypothetical protein
MQRPPSFLSEFTLAPQGTSAHSLRTKDIVNFLPRGHETITNNLFWFHLNLRTIILCSKPQVKFLVPVLFPFLI